MGGDLNLKKSWHPSTMKNMEKVWKAEQMSNQEKKRIAELKKEIEMEKDREELKKFAMDQGTIEKKEDKKLEWMYKKPNQTIDREEYLLGKEIDKNFEKIAQAEKDAALNRAPKNHVEHECIPPSLRYFSGNEQVDLARKQQEDPLFLIKKKEMETRSQLLKNPVKLKQIKQLLEEKNKRKKGKKLKKSKKHKSESESNSDLELDNLLAAKYKKLKDKISEEELFKSVKIKKKREKKQKLKSDSSDTDDSFECESDRRRHKNSIRRDTRSERKSRKREGKSHDLETRTARKDKKNWDNNRDFEEIGSSNRKEKKIRNRSDDSSDSEVRVSYKRNKRTWKKRDDSSYLEDLLSRKNDRRHMKHKNINGLEDYISIGKKFKKSDKRTSNSESSDDEGKIFKTRGQRDSSLEISPPTNFGLMKADGSRMPINPKSYSPHRALAISKKSTDKNERKWVPPKRQKLTEEEKEKRRLEMMDNANWREKDREEKFRRHMEEVKNEEEIKKTFSKDFMRKQLAAAVEVGTLESRLKSRINNIQRSNRDMNTNFARR